MFESLSKVPTFSDKLHNVPNRHSGVVEGAFTVSGYGCTVDPHWEKWIYFSILHTQFLKRHLKQYSIEVECFVHVVFFT